MSNSYDHGNPVALTIRFADRANVPGDPNIVKLLLKSSNGAETVLVYGVDQDITRASAGIYEYDFIPAPGQWRFRWLGLGASGTVRGADGGTFIVQPSGFSE